MTTQKLHAVSASHIVFDGRYINDRYHGIGRYAFHLLLETARRLPDTRFTVLRDPALPDSRFSWDTLLEMPGIREVRVSARPFSAAEQPNLARVLFPMRRLLYHTPYFPLPWLALNRSVVTVHDCIFERDPRYMPRPEARGYYRLLMAVSLRRARAVFVPSEATAEDVRRFYGVRRSKLVITPEAADKAFRPVTDQERLAQVRERYRLPEKYLLAVGARRPHKNFGMLVRAMKNVEAPLLFVGEADERFTDDAAAEARGMGERVRFLGKVAEDDLIALYGMASAVTCPSLIEGFGLPVLEAMSCGTPVVCSDIAVLREVAGSAALLIDPNSPAEWASALRRVIADDELNRVLSERGVERSSLFTWKRAAAAVVPVYRTLGAI